MFSIYLIILLVVLMAWKKTRNFAIYFLPWFLFGIIYDSMRLYPNYKVNSIDVVHLYEAEKYLFGIASPFISTSRSSIPGSDDSHGLFSWSTSLALSAIISTLQPHLGMR